MVINSAALVAILTRERAAERLVAAIDADTGCFSSALSAERGEALLFVGNDFTQTDISVCAW